MSKSTPVPSVPRTDVDEKALPRVAAAFASSQKHGHRQRNSQTRENHEDQAEPKASRSPTSGHL